MTTFVEAIDLAFSEYLLLSNVTTAGLLLALADVLIQGLDLVMVGKGRFKVTQTRNSLLVGLVLGLFNHYWYTFLDTAIEGRGLPDVGKKIVLDQLVAGPFFSSAFLVGMGTLEGKPMSVVYREWKETFLDIYMADWKFWPLAQFINFYLVPSRFTVVYVNLATLVWDLFLCYMKNVSDSRVVYDVRRMSITTATCPKQSGSYIPVQEVATPVQRKLTVSCVQVTSINQTESDFPVESASTQFNAGAIYKALVHCGFFKLGKPYKDDENNSASRNMLKRTYGGWKNSASHNMLRRTYGGGGTKKARVDSKFSMTRVNSKSLQSRAGITSSQTRVGLKSSHTRIGSKSSQTRVGSKSSHARLGSKSSQTRVSLKSSQARACSKSSIVRAESPSSSVPRKMRNLVVGRHAHGAYGRSMSKHTVACNLYSNKNGVQPSKRTNDSKALLPGLACLKKNICQDIHSLALSMSVLIAEVRKMKETIETIDNNGIKCLKGIRKQATESQRISKTLERVFDLIRAAPSTKAGFASQLSKPHSDKRRQMQEVARLPNRKHAPTTGSSKVPSYFWDRSFESASSTSWDEAYEEFGLRDTKTLSEYATSHDCISMNNKTFHRLKKVKNIKPAAPKIVPENKKRPKRYTVKKI